MIELTWTSTGLDRPNDLIRCRCLLRELCDTDLASPEALNVSIPTATTGESAGHRVG